MPSEASQKFVDAMVAFMPNFAIDFLGRKPRKKFRVTKKERLKWAEEVDSMLAAQKEIDSYRAPPKDAAEYVSRLDRVGELYGPFLGRRPKGVSFPEALRDSFRQLTTGMGSWAYFPSTNYRRVAFELDALTSAAFAKNAVEVDRIQNELWGGPDLFVVMRVIYTIIVRRCAYLLNARRKQDVRLVERLIETYRELSGLYEKGIRHVVAVMEVLEGNPVAFADIAKRPLASNVKQVAKVYPWLTKDFDIAIRNSIAHTNYLPSYSTGSITFADNKTTVTVTMRDFFRRCRNLSSLTVALMLLYVFFLYWRWKTITESYDKLKSPNRPEY